MFEEAIVSTPIHMGYYGEIGSANAMYRKYLSEFDKRYGKTKKPLAFKDWIEWAKEKELVENKPSEEEKTQEESETGEIEAAVKSTGKNIGIALLVVFALGTIYALATMKKETSA